MKCLTIRQPWVWAIVFAGKRVENRSWYCDYRGPLALHAAKGCTRVEYESSAMWMHDQELIDLGPGFLHRHQGRGLPILPPFDELPRGEIVAEASVIDCIAHGGRSKVLGGARHLRAEDRWYIGAAGIVLGEAVRPLPKPIPWVGQLGLFDVPSDVLQGAG